MVTRYAVVGFDFDEGVWDDPIVFDDMDEALAEMRARFDERRASTRASWGNNRLGWLTNNGLGGMEATCRMMGGKEHVFRVIPLVGRFIAYRAHEDHEARAITHVSARWPYNTEAGAIANVMQDMANRVASGGVAHPVVVMDELETSLCDALTGHGEHYIVVSVATAG